MIPIQRRADRRRICRRCDADPGHRLEINARLSSKRLVLADLGGFIGAAPGQATPRRAGQAHDAAASRLLPDTPLSPPELRSVDVHLHFTGVQIHGQGMPLDNMVAQLDIVEGRIGIRPLSFRVGKGEIVINLALDARQKVIRAAGDIDFRQIDLAHAMLKTPRFKGAGAVAGKARIDTFGNPVAQMLGNGDGELQLFIAGGKLSAVTVDVVGLDLGKALLSALGLPSRVAVRCAVGDYALIVGGGSIDLRDETLDFTLSTKPKQMSFGAFRGPIRIDGPLSDPRIHPPAAGIASGWLNLRAQQLIRHGLKAGPDWPGRTRCRWRFRQFRDSSRQDSIDAVSFQPGFPARRTARCRPRLPNAVRLSGQRVDGDGRPAASLRPATSCPGTRPFGCGA